jgi:hypothetical protein
MAIQRAGVPSAIGSRSTSRISASSATSIAQGHQFYIKRLIYHDIIGAYA